MPLEWCCCCPFPWLKHFCHCVNHNCSDVCSRITNLCIRRLPRQSVEMPCCSNKKVVLYVAAPIVNSGLSLCCRCIAVTVAANLLLSRKPSKSAAARPVADHQLLVLSREPNTDIMTMEPSSVN
ncbi:UNVERIFIED_CONTAM: hypothetical protein Slati_3670800 [Sesamum latifolium]|uniref:Uncharacterized protein n=1 Tax=Sesamum latifolium TaxID=2727402 RepID=A0AAW2U0M8_9LAMI